MWVALDQHTKWFGGATQQKRADLLWVKVYERPEADSKIELEIMVVESKFGDKGLVENGIIQANNTYKAYQQVFAPKNEANDDGRIWRDTLIRAIENASSLRVYKGSKNDKKIPGKIRNLISMGEYKVIDSPPSVFCHSLEETHDSKNPWMEQQYITLDFESIIKIIVL